MSRFSPAFMDSARTPTRVTGDGEDIHRRRVRLLLYIHSNFDTAAPVIADSIVPSRRAWRTIPAFPGGDNSLSGYGDLGEYLSGFEFPLFDKEWSLLRDRVDHPDILGDLPQFAAFPQAQLSAEKIDSDRWDIKIYDRTGQDKALDDSTLIMGENLSTPLLSSRRNKASPVIIPSTCVGLIQTCDVTLPSMTSTSMLPSC